MTKPSFLLLALALCAPLAAAAADSKPPRHGVKPPRPAASAPAPRTAQEARTAVRGSKQRGADMGSCRQQAVEKQLPPIEAKQYIATCLRNPPPR